MAGNRRSERVVRLNDREAQRLPGPAGGRGEVTYWDRELEGFCLRVLASGRRVWMVRYRVAGRQRWHRLGTTDAVRAAEAREAARRLLAKADLGEDPKAELERRRSETQRPTLVGKLVEQYLAFAQSRQSPAWFTDTRRYLQRYAAPLHGMRIEEVSRRELAALRATVARERGPVAANRFTAALGAFFFNWAVREGILEHNPAALLPKEKEVPRERVLSEDEIRALWTCTADASHHSLIVRLLLLTGCRREEVAGMRWSELDFHRREWLLPAERSKNRRPHLVPLTEAMLDVLARVPRIAGRDLLFGEGRGPFSGWTRAKARLDRRMAEMLGETPPRWTLHDIRRTVATGMAAIGIQPHVVEAVLNHASGHRSGVAGICNRYSYAAEKREALERWARHVAGLVEGRPPKVVALHR